MSKSSRDLPSTHSLSLQYEVTLPISSVSTSSVSPSHYLNYSSSVDYNAELMSSANSRMPNSTTTASCLLQKRLYLKRSDSGLSSDSSEHCSLHSESSASSKKSIQNYDEEEEDEGEEVDYENTQPDTYATFDASLGDYEAKLHSLSSQQNLLSAKLLNMEEHIIDLTGENQQLQSDVASQELLYRKKLAYREEEIQVLKDCNHNLEEQLEVFQQKETQWNCRKREYQREIEQLKEQISTQEGELTRMYPLEGQLSQLESALHQSTETIQTLQKDRLDSLEEQRGSFTRQLSAKDKEIGTLRLQVKELSDQVASLLEELSRKQSQQYNLSQSLHSNTSHSERRRRRRIARTKESSSKLLSLDDQEESSSEETVHLEAHRPASLASTSAVTSNESTQSPTSRNNRSMTSATPSHNSLEDTVASSSTPISIPKRKVANRDKVMMMKIFEQHNSSCDTDEENVESSIYEAPEDAVKYRVDKNDNYLDHIPSLMEELKVDTNNNNEAPSPTVKSPIYHRNSSLDFSRKDPSPPLPKPVPSSGSGNDGGGDSFPSLPDVMLRKLCLLRENTTNIESLTEAEIDSKFHTLSLAFKTDKFTLEQRVKLYRHQREVIEADAKCELTNLGEYLGELNRLLFSYDSTFFAKNHLTQLKELKTMLDRVETQCRVIQSVVDKISSKAELCGAARQEERLSTAFDVILLHLENLKRSKEKDEKELDDLRRLLSMNHCESPNAQTHSFDFIRQNSFGNSTTETIARKTVRSISGSTAPKINVIRVRRASVASIDLGSRELTRRTQLASLAPPDSPVTTTTTTTTFCNWPLGPSSTSTTVSVSNTSDTRAVMPQSSAEASLPRTRRLSVPAADFARNFRPKLFPFLKDVECEQAISEQTISEESETKSEKEETDVEDRVQIEEINDQEVNDLEEDLLQVPVPPQPKNSSTHTDIESDVEPENFDQEPSEFLVPNSSPAKPKRIANMVEDLFLSELFQKLKRLEDLEIRKKVAKSKQLYDAIKKKITFIFDDFLVRLLFVGSSGLFTRLTRHERYNQARYFISICLVLVSVFVVFYSLLFSTSTV